VDSLPESTTPPLGQTSIGNDMSIAQTSSEAGELHVLGKFFSFSDSNNANLCKVVEDNAINQKILAQQLRKAGCAKVYVADHGLDALNFLATTNFNNPSDATKTQLSIVLLDVEMPVMDGLTAAKRVRELEKSQDIKMHVPIIGITANARASQIASCIEAGMDEVVVCTTVCLCGLFQVTDYLYRPSLSGLFNLCLVCSHLLTSSVQKE
jgi:CheY-like chemotaxis protein